MLQVSAAIWAHASALALVARICGDAVQSKRPKVPWSIGPWRVVGTRSAESLRNRTGGPWSRRLLDIKFFVWSFVGRRGTSGGSISKIWFADNSQGLELPFFETKVQAGFPSPAEDHLEQRLDLNSLVIENPSATFFVRVASTHHGLASWCYPPFEGRRRCYQ